MSMATISLLSWNRFRSRSLSVVPEVVGKKHRFSYEGHKVTISLPNLKKLTSREELRKKHPFDIPLLSYNSWREINGEEHPTSYLIGAVDVVVDYHRPIKVPRGIFNRPPNAYKIVSKKRQDRLNNIADDQIAIALRAFDYWLKVLRWKSNHSTIGRSEISGNESGWGTYLLDATTRKKVWIGTNNIILVGGGRPITLHQWNMVSKVVRNGIRSPIYIDYYFDALEHLDLDDLDRCVVDLAVSCEALMRGAIGSILPTDLLNSVSKYVDKAAINTYYEDFIPEYLKPAKKARFGMLKRT